MPQHYDELEPQSLLMRLLMGSTLGESPADAALNRSGSVMGSAKTQKRQAEERAGPALSTLGSLIEALNPINWMGSPGGALAHVPGTFRRIGLDRVGGDIGTREWLARVMAEPNFKRFQELSQRMVRRGLGDEFPVYRGKGQTDPIMKALQGQGAEPATVATTTDPNIAEYFARVAAEQTRKPAFVMKGRGTPEAVPGLLPRRNTHGHEEELILQSALMPRKELAAKAVDMGFGDVQFMRPRDPFSNQPQEIIEDIMKALMP